MKKYFIFIALLMLPFFVHAASLIEGINVDGIGDISVAKKTHNLKLTTSLDYATIEVKAVEGATVEGGGKVEVKEGENTIEIKATKGEETDVHTINLTISKAEKGASKGEASETKGNPNTGAFVSAIAVGALVGIGIVFYVVSKKRKINSI